MSSQNDSVHFIDYPEPREGPSVSYKNETQSIPVFRGIPLAVGASMSVYLSKKKNTITVKLIILPS